MRLESRIVLALLALMMAAMPCRAFISTPDSTAVATGLDTLNSTIPLPYNAELLNSIKKQKSKAIPHDLVQNANTIENIIKEMDMPAELKFLPVCLKTGDKTRCGDWELTPLVAIRYGLAVTDRHDERFATEASTRAAMAYLSDLNKLYDDWWKTIMAFAYSPAMVNRLPEVSTPWDYEDNIDKAHIVRNFITYVYLYNNVELTPKEDDFLEVEFSEPISFNALAEKLKIETSEIIELNPIFLGETVYPLGDYQLRLPANKAEYFYEVEDELYKAADSTSVKPVIEKPAVAQTPKTSSKPIKYKVKKGETLSKIAQKHGTTVENLKKLNGLKSDLIREGQLLIVKNVGGSSTTTPTAKVTTPTTPKTSSGEKVTHIIKKGETLGGIAQKYKVTVSDLKKWNNLKSDKIIEGGKLVIYK